MSYNSEEKLYFTIGEASKELGVEAHVLRFWEKQFSQIKPVKTNNRRLYSKENIDLIRQIKDFLYNKGYTIKGVQKILAFSSYQPHITEETKQEVILSNITQLNYIRSKLIKYY